MGLWAIIPVKPLRRGKSRLAGILSEDERTLLNFTMLGNSLKALSGVNAIDEIVVVSRDPAALSLARDYGDRTVLEDSNAGLNMALKRATIVAQAYAASDVLVLPADLPLLHSNDIEELLKKTGKPPEIVIAPDRRMDGTNALFISPPGTIDYCFGVGSFRKHVLQAESKGMHVEVFSLPSFGLDLDLPEDLDLLRQMDIPQII